MSCKKNVLMTVGMSIRTEACQIREKVSRSPLYWMKNFPRDICGPVRDWQRFKRLPDQLMYYQKYGQKLVKPLRIEENKHGKKRCQNSTMHEDWEEFTLLILMAKITKKLSKMRSENLQGPWTQPCRAKLAPEVTASHKVPQNNLWLYGGLPRIHKATSGAFSTCKNTKITSQVKVSLRWHIPTYSSQIHSYASSNEDSRCKSCSGQRMGNTRDKSQHGNWKKSRARRRSLSKHKGTNNRPWTYLKISRWLGKMSIFEFSKFRAQLLQKIIFQICIKWIERLDIQRRIHRSCWCIFLLSHRGAPSSG